MIPQSFFYTSSMGMEIVEKCFDENFNKYSSDLDCDKTFEELDIIVEKFQPQFGKFLEKMSREKSIDTCIIKMQELSLEEKFVLKQYLRIAAFYKDFHIEMLPLTPFERMPLIYFAYLEKAFQAFQAHCANDNLSLTNEVDLLCRDNAVKQDDCTQR